MTKSLGSSKLHLEEATFTNCEIIVLIWENGSEKTTLIIMLTGDLKIVPEEKDYYVFSWSNRAFKCPSFFRLGSPKAFWRRVTENGFRALGKKANVNLIDETSAFLDSEQRITAAIVIKRYFLNSSKTGFIVEHDFIIATYLADR